jgi:hypothetical protein
MGKIKVIRVVFSILLVQLLTLSVNADEKADYLKLIRLKVLLRKLLHIWVKASFKVQSLLVISVK